MKAVVKTDQPSISEVSPQEKPQIVRTGKQLHEVAQEALDALKAGNDPPSLLVRSGELVRLISDESGRPRVEALSDAALRGRLTRAADFFRCNEGGSLSPIDPPVGVVRDIMALGEWSFPGLAGVVEVPVLRPDGTILSDVGYDPVSRLFYLPSGQFEIPPIPSEPTQADIAAAVAVVDEAIGEFPYETPASKSNAIAALLTPIVRPAISGPVPLALLDAPQQGTGKSLLSSVIALVATGRPNAMMAAPNNDEEWRKRITATLYSGTNVITIDNIEGQLKAPSLANVLTAEVWTDRILGRSEAIELPQLATWLATGNNIRLGGDLQRRAYWIRLDAKSGTPWLGREFKHSNLKGWVGENRGRIIGALLTLARAWFAGGRPRATSPVLGSYESWSITIGGILEHAGVRAFLGNLQALYEVADDEAVEWEEFLGGLGAHFQGKTFTTADVVKVLEASPGLKEKVPEELAHTWANSNKSASLPRRLGKAFSARDGRRHGRTEVRVEAAGQAGNAKKWLIAANATGREPLVFAPADPDPDSLGFPECLAA
jgi:hypothetical protein